MIYWYVGWKPYDVRAATADIDANATESKTVMMLQKCCLIVVPDVWSLF